MLRGGGLKSIPLRSCISWVRLARKSASLVLLARTLNRRRLLSTHGRMGGFPGGGRGRNLLVSCSGTKVALTGRGILLLLPDEEDRERGSSRSEESLSLGKAQGRLSQDSEGEGEWVGEPGTGLLQR